MGFERVPFLNQLSSESHNLTKSPGQQQNHFVSKEETESLDKLIPIVGIITSLTRSSSRKIIGSLLDRSC